MILWFFFATVATVTAAMVYFHEPMYRANAQILLQVGREHISDITLPTGGAVGPEIRFNQQEQIALATEILHGRHLAMQVVKAVGPGVIYQEPEKSFRLFSEKAAPRKLFDNALDAIEGRIGVKPLNKSSILNISYQHKNPKVAAQVVNTFATLYVDRHLNIRKNDQLNAFFEGQFTVLRSKLKVAEEELNDFKQQQGILSSVVETKNSLVAQQSKLEVEASETTTQKAEVAKRIERLRHQLSKTTKDPKEISILRDRLLALQLEETQLLIKYDERSPVVKDLKDEIKIIEEKLKQLSANKRYGKTSGSKDSLYGRLQEEVLRQEVELKALTVKHEVQVGRLVGYETKLKKLADAEVQFDGLQEKVLTNRENYRLYVTKFEESRISEAMDKEGIASVKILESAFVPKKPVKSKRRVAVLLSIALGGIGGIGLAFLLELLGVTIDTRRDAEQYLGVPVVAAVPELAISIRGVRGVSQWKERTSFG